MSYLFNKLRDFPEYYDTLTSLENMKQTSGQVLNGLAKAYGNDFVTFRSGQPEQIKPILEELNNLGSRQVEIEKAVCLMHFHMPQHFPQLKLLQEQLLAVFNYKASMRNNQIKMTENRTKEEARLHEITAKGRQQDIQKQQRALDAAKALEEKAIADAQTADKKFDDANKENMVKFPVATIQQLNVMIQSLKTEASANQEVAQKIIEAANKFTKFEDPVIPKLHDRLEQWEQTLI